MVHFHHRGNYSFEKDFEGNKTPKIHMDHKADLMLLLSEYAYQTRDDAMCFLKDFVIISICHNITGVFI